MNGKRIVCLCLSVLFACGVTGSLTLAAISAEPKQPPLVQTPEFFQKPLAYGGLRMLIVTEPERAGEQICVRLPDGSLVERVVVSESGEAVTDGLCAGQYLLEAEGLGRSLVSLRENASVAVLDGAGWSDGEMIHLTDRFAGFLHLVCYGETGDHHEFVLEGVENGQREISFSTPEAIGLLFTGLGEGSHRLFMDDRLLTEITVGPEHPTAQVVVERLPEPQARQVWEYPPGQGEADGESADPGDENRQPGKAPDKNAATMVR